VFRHLASDRRLPGRDATPPHRRFISPAIFILAGHHGTARILAERGIVAALSGEIGDIPARFRVRAN